MGVSENRGTPKSSILIGISIINHPFWGTTIFGNTHMSTINQPTFGTLYVHTHLKHAVVVERKGSFILVLLRK